LQKVFLLFFILFLQKGKEVSIIVLAVGDEPKQQGSKLE
jgi:hypothetical protein